MNSFNNFIEKARGLTRNPLGIIALFISLIYGFACLVLSTSIENLNKDSERLPLIWFIILFPIIILIGFIYLVVNHHEKLYAPGDYRGDDSFIQTIDRHKLKEKQLEEAKTLESAKIVEEETVATDENQNLVEENSLKDHQADNENYKAHKIDEKNLLEIYANVGKWASEELSLKYQIIFKTDVAIFRQGRKFEFDAYADNGKVIYIAEIKYWQSEKSDKKLKLAIQKFLVRHKQIEINFKTVNNEVKIIVVFVFDDLRRINKNDLLSFVKGLYSEVIVEFFDYNELKKNYE